MNSNRGFTSVELLISLTLGAMVVAGGYGIISKTSFLSNQNSARFDVERTTNLVRIAMTTPPLNAASKSVCQTTVLHDAKSGADVFPAIPGATTPISLKKIYSADGNVFAKVGNNTRGDGLASIEIVPIGNDSTIATSGPHVFETEMVLSFHGKDEQYRTRRFPLRFRTNDAGQIVDCMPNVFANAGQSTKTALSKFGACASGQVAIHIAKDGKLECITPTYGAAHVEYVGCDHPNFSSKPECNATRNVASTPAPTAEHGCLHGHYFNNTNAASGAAMMALPVCPTRNFNAPCYNFGGLCRAEGAPGHWEPMLCAQGAVFSTCTYNGFGGVEQQDGSIGGTCPYDPPGMCNGAPYTAAGPTGLKWVPNGEVTTGTAHTPCGFTPNGVRDCAIAGDTCSSFKSFGANQNIRIYDTNVCQ